uniref:Uncharacterized protein n=2 Tax=Aegilops tauschii subsp. strangulata TaxID=200361 RepID=A0A453MJD4_AEGTS
LHGQLRGAAGRRAVGDHAAARRDPARPQQARPGDHRPPRLPPRLRLRPRHPMVLCSTCPCRVLARDPVECACHPTHLTAKLRPIHQPIGRSARILVPSLSPRAFSWISDHSRISISLSVRYHANRMLSFYAPGWCGEVRDVIYNDNGKVTVVYRVTIRGIDGEVHREAAGTASLSDARLDDPVAAAEEAAFCKACARFGFGLYLYHEDEVL